MCTYFIAFLGVIWSYVCKYNTFETFLSYVVSQNRVVSYEALASIIQML